MAVQQNFRTAFNGFNREDVVRYIEQLNAKHATQISNLNAELEYLHAQQADPSLGTGSVSGEDSSLIEQQAARIRELFDRCKELEAELETMKAAQSRPAVPAASQELEAYRRAERTERLAQERAQALTQQFNGVVADTTIRVEEASNRIDTVSQQILGQLDELRCAVLGSKQVLKDATATLYALRPESQEE